MFLRILILIAGVSIAWGCRPPKKTGLSSDSPPVSLARTKATPVREAEVGQTMPATTVAPTAFPQSAVQNLSLYGTVFDRKGRRIPNVAVALLSDGSPCGSALSSQEGTPLGEGGFVINCALTIQGGPITLIVAEPVLQKGQDTHDNWHVIDQQPLDIQNLSTTVAKSFSLNSYEMASSGSCLQKYAEQNLTRCSQMDELRCRRSPSSGLSGGVSDPSTLPVFIKGIPCEQIR